jgi:hypothetical protein
MAAQLLGLKNYRNQHYREVIEDIGDVERIQEVIELSVVPHFTTIHKISLPDKVTLSPVHLQKNPETISL